MVRSVEPKLIGKYWNKTLFILIVMYVGLQLFSFAALALGPIGLVIIVTTVKVKCEKIEGNALDKADLPIR